MKEKKDYIEKEIYNLFYECLIFKKMTHAEIILIIKEFIENKGWDK